MASSGSSCADLKKMEDEFRAYEMSLMNPPSSIDDLFKILQKVESSLKMVSQEPFDSTISAIQPLMKALARNELLGHTSEDVKVSVISSVTEISRIYAPNRPYDDDRQMEEILRQTVMTFKKLADVTSRSYRKVVRVLELFAKVRFTAMILDLENETLIIEIFKIFLEVIRPYHPHNIFTWMKEIMTRLIEGSDEISVELLQLLLDRVKIDNQMDSPIASYLVEEVLKDCAAIVKPYFSDALKSMSFDPADYAQTIALLCNEMPKGKEMMATENVPATVHCVKVGPSEAKCCELARQDDTHREKRKDTCLTNIIKPVNPEDVHPAGNVPKENQEETGSHKLTGHPVKVGPSEAKFCEPVLQDDIHREKLKDTCTTNIMKPDNPENVQPATNVPKENQEGTGSHELTGSSGHHSLVSENHNNSTGSHGHLCQPKRKEIPINNDDELVVSIPIGDVPQSQVQKKDSLHLGERTKRTQCAKRKLGSDSKKNESASDCETERKSESGIKNEEGNLEEHKEPTLQQIFGIKLWKKKTKKTTNTEESRDKDSERARTSKDHGAELIGTKIKVWWPLEQAFYKGVISSFDSETNKHQVVYDDGEVEKLRLHKERWEMLEDNSSQKDFKRTFTMKDYGKELVGARIKVWWPLDEKFYEGVVSSFDPVERKHKVVYNDGETEKLRLHKEQWEMLEDNSTQKDHGLDFQGHAVSSATS
ncbi:uncharacterized protein LOC107021116 isoform X3 [Solanum pennellii]|uniref:Uncharacterized protein LOC107021116 isoform X3 n=2 Tax=Solanum pennellii TaxID=28526 RepID=A0ABM1VDL0_SOLPN|nr:uncharacterized protein LOC107021116 isoform X3 [Solanum pennellii]